MPYLQVPVGSRVRFVLLKLPRDWRDYELLGMVVSLGGNNASATATANVQGWHAIPESADPLAAGFDPRDKFVTLYPEGLGIEDEHEAEWNGGHLSVAAAAVGEDNVFALHDMINAAADWVFQASGGATAIDAAWVFLVGFSNGGELAYRAAANKPPNARFDFAALAVVCSAIGGWQYARDQAAGRTALEQVWNPATTGTAMCSVLHFGGTADDKVVADPWPALGVIPPDQVNTWTPVTSLAWAQTYIRWTYGMAYGLDLWAAYFGFSAWSNVYGGAAIPPGTLFSVPGVWVGPDGVARNRVVAGKIVVGLAHAYRASFTRDIWETFFKRNAL